MGICDVCHYRLPDPKRYDDDTLPPSPPFTFQAVKRFAYKVEKEEG